jgi:nucleoside-diphosphate-sugar epimerase
MSPTALVTGAYGYLGSLIRDRLDAAGWETIGLVREPRPDDRAVRWSLGETPTRADLWSARALVHCAYDFRPRRLADAAQINVSGTERLLRAAGDAGVSRSLVLSSMSAYSGTRQIYGRVKLGVEAETTRLGGIAIRPGLVYGSKPRGMAGTLLKLTRLPFTPDLGPAARQFPVHEDDLAMAIRTILEAPDWRPEVFGIAQPEAVDFRSLLSFLAASQGHDCRFIRVPWPAAYGILRVAEAARLSNLRADSVLGLVRPAPSVPSSSAFPELLEQLRSVGGPESTETRSRRKVRDD